MRVEYLCALTANTYGIEFQRFTIKDYDSGQLVYQVLPIPHEPTCTPAAPPHRCRCHVKLTPDKQLMTMTTPQKTPAGALGTASPRSS
jgi:hypothetical protein